MSSLSSVASSAASSISQPPISFTGLISGLDTSSVVKGLLAVDQAQINVTTNKETRVQGEQTAYKQVEAKLLTLQGDVRQLSAPTNGVFQALTATSSNTSVVTAAASSSAAPGVYNLQVTDLAQAQEIASQGFASPSSTVTRGTLQLQTGSGAATTITVDATNDTLQGLAATINHANAGVTASVINDGSGGQSYRLLIVATKTGTANAVTITNNLAADSGGAVQPLFNTHVQDAKDASVTLGSGAGALVVTSSTNQINNLLPGVTLQLLGTNPGSHLTVTVASDTTGTQKAIDNFVADYNSLMAMIDQQTSFDAASNTAAPLLGDSKVSEIQNQIRNMVQNVVPGVSTHLNQLGALGITVNKDGQLQVDDSKLANVLAGNTAATLTDVRTLFGMSGSSPNTGVQFITGNEQTKASSTPYQVNITQAATQGAITTDVSAPLPGQITIGNASNTFSLAVDGRSTTVTLASNTYSQTDFAKMLQATINSSSDLGGRQVSVSVQNNQLTITSATYGSASQIAIGSGSANTVLSLAGTESAQGTDVVGSYVVDGVTETAKGIGQVLTGTSTNAHTAGLVVRVSLTPDQVGGGTQTTLSVTRGIASQLNALLNSFTDSITGRFKTIDNGFNQELTDLEAQKTQQTNAMNAKQQQLLTEFADMEKTLAQLQAVSNALNSLSSNTSTTTSSSSPAPRSTSSSTSSGS